MDSDTRNRLAEKIRRELGPHIQAALTDDRVVEVARNEDGAVWVEYLGSGFERVGEMSDVQAESLIGTVAAVLNLEARRDTPLIGGELPFEGSRFQGVLPPISLNPIFSIRKHISRLIPLDQYVSDGAMSIAQANALRTAVAERRNIVLVGGTGGGKTTLANAVIQQIGLTHPADRVILIEDTRELKFQNVNLLSLRTSPTVSLNALVRTSMRLRPDRIIVGEVRGGEALELLKSWNTGHPGGVATLHANSCLGGLYRLEQLIEEVSTSSMGRLIADAVDLLVHMEKTNNLAGRRVTEMTTVAWRDGEYVLENAA